MNSTISSVAQIRSLLGTLPGPDQAASAAWAAREPLLTKPAGALGRLEELAEWMSTWQGQHPPGVHRSRVAVFAGNHGVAVHGVSAYPVAVTAQMVKNFQDGGAAAIAARLAVLSTLRLGEANGVTAAGLVRLAAGQTRLRRPKDSAKINTG